MIGNLESLPEAIRDSGANEVIIADPQVNGDALFEVMMRCGRRRGVEFRIAPSLFNCLPRKTEIDQIGVLPMIRLFREPLSSGARILKRTFDLIVVGARDSAAISVLAADCAADQAGFERPGLLHAGTRRHGWPAFSALQVSHDEGRRRS